MRVVPIDERTSAVLNVMRWMAALAVVLTHINDRLFLPLSETPEEHRTLAFMAWKFVSASGNSRTGTSDSPTTCSGVAPGSIPCWCLRS
jgi:peptidoglycan/LPS O-acetylase OafA/YrhL